MAEKPSIDGLVSALLDAAPAKKKGTKPSSSEAVAAASAALNKPVVEHRRHTRFRVKWRAAIIVNNGSEQLIKHGITKDVSLGGISILLEDNFCVDGTVTVVLQIPMHQFKTEYRILETKARMIHTVFDGAVSQFRAGIEFLEFKAGDKSFLENHLASRHFPLA